MSAGYSGTPLARKLGIRAGSRVAVLGAPEGFGRLLEPLPEDVHLRVSPRGTRCWDVVVAFARARRELARRFARGRSLLCENGGLWLCWPKGSSALARDLKESHVRDHGLSTGLVDNKICALDDDWSGLRFVVRLKDRQGPGGSRR